jgi:hypothetical protein
VEGQHRRNVVEIKLSYLTKLQSLDPEKEGNLEVIAAINKMAHSIEVMRSSLWAAIMVGLTSL